MKIFISAEKSDLNPYENQDRTHFLLGWLHATGYNFKRVLGVYNGHHEQSFIIESTNDSDYLRLLSMSKKLEQESILRLDNDNKAYLVFTNDLSVEPLGRMIKVNETVAKMQSNYTWDKEANEYYVTNSFEVV